jgi:KEOPS complex subunit Cgi121
VKLVEGTVYVADVDAFVADLDVVASRTGTTVQAFDARYVVSRRHLARAVELADRAIHRGDAIARERAVEILLYAAGRRQITDAFELGVSAGDNRVVVLVDATDAGDGESAADAPSDGPAAAASDGDSEADAAAAIRSEVLDTVEPTLGEYDSERVREYFDVDDPELDVVDGDIEALVCERVALLVVEQ